VTVLRYLCAQGSKLGVSVLSRISDTHDVLTLIVPLIDNPPWTRRIKGKVKKALSIFLFILFYSLLLTTVLDLLTTDTF
jgi:hypothetical protein